VWKPRRRHEQECALPEQEEHGQSGLAVGPGKADATQQRRDGDESDRCMRSTDDAEAGNLIKPSEHREIVAPAPVDLVSYELVPHPGWCCGEERQTDHRGAGHGADQNL